MTPNLHIKRHILPWIDTAKKIHPTCIVLHWWGEPINEQGVEYLASLLQKRKLSVQYAVLANGEIYQLSPTPDTFCRHAKCANDSAIGIEIEGFDKDDLDNNQNQFESVIQLVRKLVNNYNMQTDLKVKEKEDQIRFFGIASHKLVDVYCSNANGKDDVHDNYVERVKLALKNI